MAPTPRSDVKLGLSSPYRSASPRAIAIPWRVTRWQKLFVRVARWLGCHPFDDVSLGQREWRRYQRALLRWRRDWSERRRAPGPKPFPPMPLPPPRRISE